METINTTIDAFFDEQDRVFKDGRVFTTGYLPDVFLFREQEFKEVGYTLKSLFDNINTNAYISGPSGTGKTHICKALIKGFNDKSEILNKNVLYVLVNCRGKTYPSVLADMLHQFNSNAPTRGLSTSEIIKKIKKHVSKQNVGFIFDEIDRIVPSYPHWKPLEEAIGTFTRFADELKIDFINSTIIIANNPALADELDDSTQSSFCAKNIRFRQYNADEIGKILKERCDLGFQEGIIEDGLIHWLASMICKHDHDLRIALTVLGDAGIRMREQERTKIELNDLKVVLKKAEKSEVVDLIKDLNDIQLTLLYSIANIQLKHKKDKFAVTSDALWEKYLEYSSMLKLDEKSQRHVFDYVIPKLEAMGLFTTGKRGLGRGKGRIKYFRLQDSYLDKIADVICESLNERFQVTFKKDVFKKYETALGSPTHNTPHTTS